MYVAGVCRHLLDVEFILLVISLGLRHLFVFFGFAPSHSPPFYFGSACIIDESFVTVFVWAVRVAFLFSFLFFG